MRLSVRELKRLVREGLSGSQPEQTYEGELADDPALKKQSVLVPDDIKRSIGTWMSAMGLSSKKKKHSRSS